MAEASGQAYHYTWIRLVAEASPQQGEMCASPETIHS
jgi:hypothetical protein